MKVYLYKFTSTIDNFYLTNDNYPHTVGGLTYSASAIDSKEIVFDLKEIVGEVNLSLPWSQAGFLKDHLQNPFDAPIKLDILSYDTSAGSTVLTFSGFVNTYKIDQNTLELGVLSFIEQARDNFPRAVVTRCCNHQHYGPACTVNPTPFTDVVTLLDWNSTRTRMYVSGVTVSNWYRYGYIYAENSYRHITSDSPYQYIVNGTTIDAHFVDVLHPAPSSWTLNMTLNLVAGCDKTMQTCTEKFSAFAHYLGFPHAPYETIRLTGLRSAETEIEGGKK